MRVTPGFQRNAGNQHTLCRLRIRFRNRFRKNRVRTCRSVNAVAVCRCRSAQRGSSAAGPVGRPASFPRKSGQSSRRPGYGKTEKYNSTLYERINGNGELTETEKVFLRKLRSSYGIFTDERNSYVLLQRKRRYGYTEERIRNAGNHALGYRLLSDAPVFQPSAIELFRSLLPDCGTLCR